MIMKLNDTNVHITNFYENLGEHATMNATNSRLDNSEMELRSQYTFQRWSQ